MKTRTGPGNAEHSYKHKHRPSGAPDSKQVETYDLRFTQLKGFKRDRLSLSIAHMGALRIDCGATVRRPPILSIPVACIRQIALRVISTITVHMHVYMFL
jgi:hypothetical protein